MTTTSVNRISFGKFFMKQDDSKNLDTEWIEKVLEAHNKYRAAHGVPPLKLKKEITTYSQLWAEKLLKKKSMQHSAKSDRPNYGENIFWSSSKSASPDSAVDSWYSECTKFRYQYGKEPTNLSTGHFTQVVWKNTQYLGVGVATGDAGTFVVCNYEPPGNYIGEFAANVCPPVERNL